MRRVRLIALAALVMVVSRPAAAQTPAHLCGTDSSATWRALGDALFNEQRHREAIAAYERALQLGAAEPGSGAWQIARAYARVGNRKQALRWLGHAVALGFDDRDAFRREPAFEQYHDDPRFSASIDAPRAGRRSPPRLPASRARHPLIAEIKAT